MALDTNCVAYYKFNESSGNALDSVSGSTYITNNWTITYAAAKIGNWAVFSWTGQFFDSVYSLRWLTAWSIWFWIYPTDVSNFRNVYSIYYQTSGYQDVRQFRIDNSSKISLVDMVSTSTSSTNSLVINQWHYVVLTKTDATHFNLYIRWAVTENKAFTQTINTNSLSSSEWTTPRIGKWGSFWQYAQWTIDEFGIWNRVLSQSEVDSLYNSGSWLTYPFATASTTNASFLYNMI